MRSHTQTRDRGVPPIWPWQGTPMAWETPSQTSSTPPRCLWKHQENPSQVRRCKGWTGTPQNVVLAWCKDFCNPTQDQGWLCLVHTLGVSIPCQPPGSNTSQKWALGQCWTMLDPHQGHHSSGHCHSGGHGQHQETPSLLQVEFRQLLSPSQSWRRSWRSSCARCWSVLSPR